MSALPIFFSNSRIIQYTCQMSNKFVGYFFAKQVCRTHQSIYYVILTRKVCNIFPGSRKPKTKLPEKAELQPAIHPAEE